MSSVQLVTETLNILRSFVGGQRYESAVYLMKIVRAVGRRLLQVKPFELVISNSILRVLFLIREECQSLRADVKGTPLSLDSSVSILDIFDEENQKRKQDIRPVIIDAITELLLEVENLDEPISKQALDHIHSNEAILVSGYSATLLNFLLFAKKHDRLFSVFVLESSPNPEGGHLMAFELSKKGISTTLIPDSACHALMPHISKIFISPKSILASGAVLAASGSNLLSLSAKYHNVPFVCIAGLHKLAPQYNLTNGEAGDRILGAAGEISAGLDLSDIPLGKNVKLLQSKFDVIEPQQVSLLVTNTGGHQTTYLYRLLAEYFHPEDRI